MSPPWCWGSRDTSRRTGDHAPLFLPPPLAVNGGVTCLLAGWGSGAISGLGEGGVAHSVIVTDSADKDNNHPNNNH